MESNDGRKDKMTMARGCRGGSGSRTQPIQDITKRPCGMTPKAPKSVKIKDVRTGSEPHRTEAAAYTPPKRKEPKIETMKANTQRSYSDLMHVPGGPKGSYVGRDGGTVGRGASRSK
jgi:hypothetical protein